MVKTRIVSYLPETVTEDEMVPNRLYTSDTFDGVYIKQLIGPEAYQTFRYLEGQRGPSVGSVGGTLRPAAPGTKVVLEQD